MTKGQQIILIIHNVRSSHNVGSLLRSADGFGIDKVYITGFSPYPAAGNDQRLPHIAAKTSRAIHKTALGAENSLAWEYAQDISEVIDALKASGFYIAAIEQTSNSKNLNNFKPTKKTVLIVGNEVEGIDEKTLSLADTHIEIPMRGKKESFNVAIAGSIAMYYLTNLDNH
jgi:23S rRNA (guanosine2251-2'-O)-methyltransferase